eukprot:403334664
MGLNQSQEIERQDISIARPNQLKKKSKKPKSNTKRHPDPLHPSNLLSQCSVSDDSFVHSSNIFLSEHQQSHVNRKDQVFFKNTDVSRTEGGYLIQSKDKKLKLNIDQLKLSCFSDPPSTWKDHKLAGFIIYDKFEYWLPQGQKVKAQNGYIYIRLSKDVEHLNQIGKVYQYGQIHGALFYSLFQRLPDHDNFNFLCSGFGRGLDEETQTHEWKQKSGLFNTRNPLFQDFDPLMNDIEFARIKEGLEYWRTFETVKAQFQDLLGNILDKLKQIPIIRQQIIDQIEQANQSNNFSALFDQSTRIDQTLKLEEQNFSVNTYENLIKLCLEHSEKYLQDMNSKYTFQEMDLFKQRQSQLLQSLTDASNTLNSYHEQMSNLLTQFQIKPDPSQQLENSMIFQDDNQLPNIQFVDDDEEQKEKEYRSQSNEAASKEYKKLQSLVSGDLIKMKSKQGETQSARQTQQRRSNQQEVLLDDDDVISVLRSFQSYYTAENGLQEQQQ